MQGKDHEKIGLVNEGIANRAAGSQTLGGNNVFDYESMFMRAASGSRAHLWFAAFLAGTSPGALPSEASLARLPVQDRMG